MQAGGHGAIRVAVVALVASLLIAVPAGAPANALPAHQPGFALEPIFGGYAGLQTPTAVRFAPDGKVFVAEKAGKIKVFDSIYDSTPTQVLDISTEVNSNWDRGLLGLAIDPDFPTSPYIYTLYTWDTGDQWPALDGSNPNPPKWNDVCPDPPGGNDDGCVVDGRLSRFQVGANGVAGPETVLLQGYWCQQFLSHSVGDLAFGDDGYLYASAGDGAAFSGVDLGDRGGDPEAGNRVPVNPCNDPDPTPGPPANSWDPRGTPTLPDTEGGKLRSQDILTSGDPLSYDGTVIRIDPDTGHAAPGNPMYVNGTSPALQPDEARVIAHGLRNPFRMTVQPGSGDLYVGDVGYGGWEEINRVTVDSSMENFGWPCYEGGFDNGAGYSRIYAGLDSRNVVLCEGLYAGTITGPSTLAEPFYAYRHGQGLAPDPDGCPANGASISGLAFIPDGPYPASYDGGLAFADYAHQCVWIMYAGGGTPNPNSIDTLVSGRYIVDVQAGPGGELYLVDIVTSKVFRLTYAAGNQAPVAGFTVSPPAPEPGQTVVLDGTASADPHGDTLTYQWDLDNDGVFGAADGEPVTAKVTTSFPAPGTYPVSLRVRDFYGATSTTSKLITVTGPNQAPHANPDSYTVAEGSTLSVTSAIGVLTNDTDADLDVLTAQIVTNPSRSSSFVFNSDGSFTYTHDGSETTSDSFSYRAFDGAAYSPTAATVSLTITPRNDVPVLAPIPDVNGVELTEITFQANATDPDVGAQLTYSLVSAPPGASINPSTGRFTWTPTEAQGPGTYAIGVTVSDGFSADSTVVTVIVAEKNEAPDVINPGPQAAAEGGTVSLQIVASDPDIPTSALTYTASGLPPGLSLHPATGVISGTLPYTTAGTYEVTVTVTDSGEPELSTDVHFDWIVSATNQPPRLSPIPDQTGNEGETITFTASAVDPDNDSIVYSLAGGPDPVPAGASIDPVSGVFTWTPTPAQSPGTFRFSVRATDDGDPPLFDGQVVTFATGVINEAPVLDALEDFVVAEGALVTFTATATDNDPGDEFTFTLEEEPDGAVIDPNTGVFSWTPDESQGPGSYSFAVRVTDDGIPALSDVRGLVALVTEVNQAPTLDPPDQITASEHVQLSFSVNGTDPDIPANQLTYSLVSAPPNTTLNPLTGVVTWTPGEQHGGTQVSFTIRALDNGSPALAAQATVVVNVVETNDAPVLDISAPGGSLSWVAGEEVFFAGSALDPEDGQLPGASLSWELLLHHCASIDDCHVHQVEAATGNSGSFQAPDHEYPAFLELVLRATDSQGLTSVISRELHPQTVEITFTSTPLGLAVTLEEDHITPFVVEVIVNSQIDFGVAPTQVVGGRQYEFVGWSDGGSTFHSINAPAAATTLNVTFTNHSPVATADTYTVERGRVLLPDGRLPINVLSNDTDAEGDPMTAEVVTPPAHAASFQVLPDGTFTYAHDGSPQAVDSFTYRAFDGLSYSAPVTVAVNVVAGPSGLIRLPGRSGAFIRAKDAPAFAVSSLDVRMAVALDEWQRPGGTSYLAGQYGPVSRSWRLGVRGGSNGSRLFLQVYSPNVVSYTSSEPITFSNGELGYVRATWDPDTGSAAFFTSLDGITWNMLGQPISGLSGELKNSVADVHIGSGTSAGDSNLWAGAFAWMELRDGTGGDTVARLDVTTTSQLATVPPQYARWRDPMGNDWLLRGPQRTWVPSASNHLPVAFVAKPKGLATVTGEVKVSVKAGDVEDAPGSLDVEVSTDGGATWHPAIYRALNKRYQYDWPTSALPDSAYVVAARVTDGNGAVVTPDTRRVWVGNNLPYSLRLPGTSGTAVSTPPGNHLDTDDLSVKIQAAPDQWKSATGMNYLASRWGTDNGAWRVGLDDAGRIVLETGTPAPSSVTSTAAVPFAAGETGHIRVDRSAATGAVKFWTSSNGTGWTRLGATQSGEPGPLRSIAARLTLGAGDNNGTVGTWSGEVMSFELKAGGDVIAGLDLTSADQLTSSPPDFSRWLDAAGNVWFVRGAGWDLLGPE